MTLEKCVGIDHAHAVSSDHLLGVQGDKKKKKKTIKA